MLCGKFRWNWLCWFWRRWKCEKFTPRHRQRWWTTDKCSFDQKRWKCEKFTERRIDGWMTDNRWSEKLNWAISSGELKNKREKQFKSSTLFDIYITVTILHNHFFESLIIDSFSKSTPQFLLTNPYYSAYNKYKTKVKESKYGYQIKANTQNQRRGNSHVVIG